MGALWEGHSIHLETSLRKLSKWKTVMHGVKRVFTMRRSSTIRAMSSFRSGMANMFGRFHSVTKELMIVELESWLGT